MSEGRLVKPQLRGLHINYLKKSLIGTLVVSVLSGIIYKLTILDPFHKRMEDFYKTYDAEKSLQKMNEAGLMQSCPQD